MGSRSCLSVYRQLFSDGRLSSGLFVHYMFLKCITEAYVSGYVEGEWIIYPVPASLTIDRLPIEL